MNNNWPFNSTFMYIYNLARKSNWLYENKPVTIGWLLGFYGCLFEGSIKNPFGSNSLAWNDFCNGFDCCNKGDKRYAVLIHMPVNASISNPIKSAVNNA